MRRLEYTGAKSKKKYISKPYEQMTYPGERLQIDVKFVPLSYITTKDDRYYQYTAIEEYSWLRYLKALEEYSGYSSAVFLKNTVAFFRKYDFSIDCIQTNNGLELANYFNRSLQNKPILFEATLADLSIRHKLIRWSATI